MDINEYNILKKLVLTDVCMLRFRKIFREMGISWSDEKFAKTVKYNWFIQNHSMTGTKTRQGQPIKRGLRKPLPGRTYIAGIYKSKNWLKNFLKCESCNCPSPTMLLALEERLGFKDEEFYQRKAQYGFLEKEEVNNPKFKERHKYDICTHLKPGGSPVHFLEAGGFLVLQKDGSYVPTSKFWSSPRVVLRQKILKKEAEKLQKARKAQAEMAGKSKVDSVKNRLANLKRFFNISKWENKKEGA